MADTAALAKEGKLADFVQKQFGGKLKEEHGSDTASPSASPKAPPPSDHMPRQEV